MKKAFLAIGFLLLCATLVVGQTQKPVTLKMLFYSPELADQYNDMADAYKAQTGNTLDITVLQSDFVTVLRAKLNSGDIPDVS